MEGVLDSLVRELLTEVNDYDLCITEFLRVVDQLLPVKSFYRLCPELHHQSRTPSGTRVRVQLLGQYPEWLAENAARAVALGSWGVDLNCGCPSKLVNGSGGGATLLKDPELIYRGAKAMREAVPEHLPVTVKVRLGWDSGERRFEIADAVQPLTAAILPATDVAPVSEAPDGPTATKPAGDRAAGLTAIADGEQPQPAKTVNQRRAERGISSRTSLFVPKGQWVFGGTVSYSTHNNRDYDVLVIDDITSEGYTFKVSPMIGYALGNNSTLGVRFIYGRTLLKLDGANVSFGNGDSSTDLSVDYYYALRHSYSFAAVYRRYIPFGESKRFGIFTDIQLLFGGSQGKFAADSPIKGTFQRGFDFELGLSPGLIAFATNSMAVEVNVGMMGIGYSRVRQVHNQVTTGTRHQSAMNFKVNLLSIGLGISFYL